MRKIVTLLFVLGLLGAAPATLTAQTFRLRSGEVTFVTATAKDWLAQARGGAGAAPQQVLVKLSGAVNEDTRKSLAGSGIRLFDYLGGDVYVATISRSNPQDGPAIRIASLPAYSKWSGSQIPAGRGEVAIAVSILSPEYYSTLLKWLQDNGGVLSSSKFAVYGLYEIKVAASKVSALLSQYYVKTATTAGSPQPLNREAQRATKTNLLHTSAAQGGYGLQGDSITIGVGDNIPAIFHVDTRDRVINFSNNFAGSTNHGQHVNGTVGGAGTIDPATEGFAPHARLLDHQYDLLLSRAGTLQQDYGMSVTNNSYAAIVGDCAAAGTYDVYAQYMDTMALQYPSLMHVFAAGNDGNLSCSPYPAGFGTVVGQFQAAKNVLVVGNVTRQYTSYFNSSRGPSKDGRIKPEIVTTGSDVTSCAKFDTYVTAGATSFSSPQVAGVSGLLQQRYKNLHGGAYPPSDLVKCLLMNGAMDIGNPGPDYSNGFGVLDAARSIQMLDSNRYYAGTLGSNAMQTATINIPPNTGQVKVMLYWHDVPASPLAAAQLINDLDLEVAEPSALVHQPLILKPGPAQILTNAVEGRDSLNNVEQVVINAPAAGTYTIKVKSQSIAGASQRYVITYDLMPDAVKVTFPSTGSIVKANDSLRIYWDASPGTSAFTVELSTNNGASWTTLGTAAATQHFFDGLAPTAGSEQCLVRVSRGGQQSVSGNFVISAQPVLTLNAVQCPGYVNLQWTVVPGATSYRVLRKKGYYLQTEATVTGTSYAIAGLPQDSLCYAAVQPLINGVPGYRSLAIKRLPNDGACTGSFSDGDLAIVKIISPQSGRQSTSTALSTSENLVLLVANHDDVAATNYQIAYRINGGAWQSAVATTSIPAASAALATIPGLNLGAVGAYTITAAVTNLSLPDGVLQNDTVIRVVRQLANPPLNIAAGVTDDFESSGAFEIRNDSIGITANDRWDFYNSTDSARVRSFVTSDVTIGGSRSISLDAIQNLGAMNATNFLTGTFNATGYQAGVSEVRFQFDYRLHGKPQSTDSNAVWVRGSDTQPWIFLYRYDTSVTAGDTKSSGSLSLSSALTAAGQDFSSSTQIRFGQRDTSLIELNDYGNGLTLDNVRLYIVQNDVALTSVVSPADANCGMSASTPLVVTVKNGVAATQNNVLIAYRLDGGPVQTDTIATIAGNATITYTFPQALNTAAPGLHRLNIWIVANGDTYQQNDSIMGYTFRNEPLINTFPYSENFESNDGYYYAGGQNSSWAYGTPASTGVPAAASGTKAWKTNLTGNYSSNEHSYLYSPCFDVSRLGGIAVLSFNAVINFEDCRPALCDAAWVEYSLDNRMTWNKLGAGGPGTNWYTDTARNVWTGGNTSWRAYGISLPISSSLQLRWVVSSDAGTNLEGLAIDDVRITNVPIDTAPPGLYVYPNPVRDGVLHLDWSLLPASDFRAVLTDVQGKKLRDIQSDAAANRLDIDLGGVARGIYILHSTIGGKTYKNKISVL